jgi:hypothetical protein
VVAWDHILGLGRAVGIHVIACPHRPTVKALGGDVARDNFGLVFVMATSGAGTLRLVDPSLRYEPLPAIPGRALALHGGHHTIIQALWDPHRQLVAMLADHYGQRDLDESRDDRILAEMEADLAGRRPGESASIEAMKDNGTQRSVPAGPGTQGAGQGAETRGDGPHGPEVVTLEEAWQRGLVGQGVQFDTVKRARTRARDAIRQFDDEDAAEAAGWWFPPVVATGPAPGGREVQYYEAASVVRWWNGRVRQSPDDGEWWVYWLVEGGVEAVTYGGVVKIGYTDGLRQRLSAFGKNWPGADVVGGDIVYLERYPSRSKAMAREAQLHGTYEQYDRDGRPGVSLRCYPPNTGGKGGRETFWIEGPLAADMARHCPSRRAALQRQVTT